MADHGLGYQHQLTRRRLLAALRDGDPCHRCGGPMYRADAARLDSDHVIDRALGGIGGEERLSHMLCNRRAGGALGARMRGQRRAAVIASLPPLQRMRLEDRGPSLEDIAGWIIEETP